MGDIILPGAHGIGTQRFIPIDSGYDAAADVLLKLRGEGYPINASDREVQRVLEYHGVSTLCDLQMKLRGY